MKALVYEGKERMCLQERLEPKVENIDDVKVAVKYTGICGTDIVIWQGGMTSRVIPPVILGHEFVGVVTESASEKFNSGDRVAVEPLVPCGKCLACCSGRYNACKSLKLLGVDFDGAFAPYVVFSADKMYKLPDKVRFEDAVFIEPLAVAIHMVRRTHIEANDYVTVLGAGTVGLLISILCREMMARKVIIAEVNPYRIKLAREYGFDVVDNSKENLKERILLETEGEGSDITFEMTGHPACEILTTDITRVGGVVLQGSMFKKPPEVHMHQLTLKELTVIGSRVYTNRDFNSAISTIESGRINLVPLLTKILSLDEVVEEGFKAIAKGEQVMKAVVKFS